MGAENSNGEKGNIGRAEQLALAGSMWLVKKSVAPVARASHILGGSKPRTNMEELEAETRPPVRPPAQSLFAGNVMFELAKDARSPTAEDLTDRFVAHVSSETSISPDRARYMARTMDGPQYVLSHL